MIEEVCLSMKFSRIFTCSVMGLCVKRPPAVMSRPRSACVLIPKQKSHNNMLSDKDKSRVACICNSPGVCHSLSSGFELKHDGLSGDDDVKANLRR
jgi:hypothetical protein